MSTLRLLKEYRRFVTSASALAFLTLALPVASFSTALLASGNGGSASICEIGVACPDPNNTATAVGIGPAPLASGGSMGFIYTFANGDQYAVTGSYSASYATGTFVQFSPNVIYLGNSGNAGAPSAGLDTLTLDLYQNFYDNGPGGWSGPPAACEFFNVDVGSSGTATADLSYGGQPIGTLAANHGVSNQSLCKVLTIPGAANTAAFLNSDFDMTFTFAESTAPGSLIISVPEPSSVALTFLGAAGILFSASRRFRQRSR